MTQRTRRKHYFENTVDSAVTPLNSVGDPREVDRREAVSTLVARLEKRAAATTGIIRWSCPVPSFGDWARAQVATVGINPSNLEFVDREGNELIGASRRLPTLRSLGISKWSDATEYHVDQIIKACQSYFDNNPYDRWFRSLDNLLEGLPASYYGAHAQACHLDLVPYGTRCKWTELSTRQRLELLDLGGDTLGLLLRASPIRLLVLNGATVAKHLERLSGAELVRRKMAEWSLPRRGRAKVPGVAFSGTLERIADVPLGRPVHVLGFNHNIQSSFGVTTKAKTSIRRWLSISAREVLP